MKTVLGETMKDVNLNTAFVQKERLKAYVVAHSSKARKMFFVSFRDKHLKILYFTNIRVKVIVQKLIEI